MFCTNCGRKISISESRCPFCGVEQAKLEGGNSFWDMADSGQTSTAKEAVDMGSSHSLTVIKERSTAPMILSVIALIIGIVGLFSIATVKKNADSRMAGYDDNIINTTIAEEDERNRIADLENKNQELELIVDAMQTELEQMKTAMATPFPEETAPDVTDEAEIIAIEVVADEYTEENNAQDMMISEEDLDKDSGINTFEPEHSVFEIFGD